MKMQTITIGRKSDFRLPLLDYEKKCLYYVPARTVTLDRGLKLYIYDKGLYLWNGRMVFDLTINGKVTKSVIQGRLDMFKTEDSFWSVVESPANNATPEDILSSYIKYSDYEVQERLLTVMGIGQQPMGRYYDYLYKMRGEYRFDVVRIDNYLKSTYPEEYPDNISMRDFLGKKWGIEFAEQFAEYI